jgi:hypothetical protein
MWAEYDPVEGRDRSVPAQLELGGALDIVEHRPRRSPARKRPKVRDRTHAAPAIGRPAPKSRSDKPRKISCSRELPLHPGHLPSVDDRRPRLRRAVRASRAQSPPGTGSPTVLTHAPGIHWSRAGSQAPEGLPVHAALVSRAS